MDFSFDSIIPELICLLIIPEYYSGNLVLLVLLVRLSTHPLSSLAVPPASVSRIPATRLVLGANSPSYPSAINPLSTTLHIRQIHDRYTLDTRQITLFLPQKYCIYQLLSLFYYKIKILPSKTCKSAKLSLPLHHHNSKLPNYGQNNSLSSLRLHVGQTRFHR